jgi:outer membrane murein-binding lipoprotein Lpp
MPWGGEVKDSHQGLTGKAAHWGAVCSQSGSQLSSQLDTLSAERDALSGTVRQREAELLAAQSLVQEKEEALSQEQRRSSQERGELQGQLAEKVRPPSSHSTTMSPC